MSGWRLAAGGWRLAAGGWPGGLRRARASLDRVCTRGRAACDGGPGRMRRRARSCGWRSLRAARSC